MAFTFSTMRNLCMNDLTFFHYHKKLFSVWKSFYKQQRECAEKMLLIKKSKLFCIEEKPQHFIQCIEKRRNTHTYTPFDVCISWWKTGGKNIKPVSYAIPEKRGYKSIIKSILSTTTMMSTGSCYTYRKYRVSNGSLKQSKE